MVAAVAVQNIDGVNLVEIVFFGVGRKDGGDARVEAGAQKGGQAGLFEAFVVGPLPGVVKVGGEALFFAALLVDGAPGGIVRILRLIVGGIDVVDAAGQAGVHDGQILIGQGHVQDGIGLIAADQGDHVLRLVGVDLGGGDHGGGAAVELSLEGIAFGFGAAGDAELGENSAVLTAFLNGDLGDTAAADDQ